MGWKSIREHYRIGHIVHVSEGMICIGSPYIHDIIKINMFGQIVKRCERTMNAELERYQAEFDANPATLQALAQADDTFERFIPVFTWEGATIIECACETLGWPNVTHCGRMMFENTFSTDWAETVSRAIKDAEADVSIFTRHAKELAENAAENAERLAACTTDLTSLLAMQQSAEGAPHAG